MKLHPLQNNVLNACHCSQVRSLLSQFVPFLFILCRSSHHIRYQGLILPRTLTDTRLDISWRIPRAPEQGLNEILYPIWQLFESGFVQVCVIGRIFIIYLFSNKWSHFDCSEGRKRVGNAEME